MDGSVGVGWRVSAATGEEEGKVVMGASLQAGKELELALDQRGRWRAGILNRRG
uniref:hypothetical protein n=1 Tax=Cupriavidus taiwanensis TaxID=164546 RepID=UPI0018DC061B|nr:hypothetical protein [Cupriavidus taiwanensis]